MAKSRNSVYNCIFFFFSVGAFNQGAVNKAITASFTSNCCHPKVLFVGLDLVGNTGTCSISLVPDIVSLRAKPNTTAVSLYPGNTTRVLFTLTNLGSKGSFAFEVTNAPALISYVTPFTLALQANATTFGHLVINSRSENIEVQNLTVIAVSQSDEVNVRKVALFSIRVSILSDSEPATPADTVSLKANPSTTAVSLHYGDSTKVPFKLINLGSNGSFSFEVTNTSALICYVMPSSLVLQTNATATGELAINSRDENERVYNLTIEAVLHSSKVSVRKIPLFSVQVSVSKAQPKTKIFNHLRLEAVIPADRFSLAPGESLDVNFTIRNLMLDNTFTFHVSFIFFCFFFVLEMKVDLRLSAKLKKSYRYIFCS